MTVQLLGKDDSGLEDSELLTGRWQGYIDSFVAVSWPLIVCALMLILLSQG